MEQSKIDRISELTKISRTRPLTAQETAQRKMLRKEYIESFKKSLTSQLDNTYIVSPDGTKKKIKRKK